MLCTFHDRAGFSADVRRQRSFEDWRAAVAQGKAVRLRFARALLGKQRKCFLAWRDWYRQNLEERRGPRKVVEAVVAMQARQRGHTSRRSLHDRRLARNKRLLALLDWEERLERERDRLRACVYWHSMSGEQQQRLPHWGLVLEADRRGGQAGTVRLIG